MFPAVAAEYVIAGYSTQAPVQVAPQALALLTPVAVCTLCGFPSTETANVPAVPPVGATISHRFSIVSAAVVKVAAVLVHNTKSPPVQEGKVVPAVPAT